MCVKFVRIRQLSQIWRLPEMKQPPDAGFFKWRRNQLFPTPTPRLTEAGAHHRVDFAAQIGCVAGWTCLNDVQTGLTV